MIYDAGELEPRVPGVQGNWMIWLSAIVLVFFLGIALERYERRFKKRQKDAREAHEAYRHANRGPDVTYILPDITDPKKLAEMHDRNRKAGF